MVSSSGVKLSSAELLPLLDQNVADLIAVINSDRKRIWHNEAYCRTLGYTRAELEKEDSHVKIHPDDLPRVAAAFDHAMASGQGEPCSYRMEHKSGGWLHLESNARVVDLPGQGRCLILVARDVTDRVRLEAQLQAELKEAADYVTSLLPEPVEGPLQTDWRFIPSTSLGGDAFFYDGLDDRFFRFGLLDVCGHGMGAALLSISAINCLRSRTLPETDFLQPAQVLTHLNLAFPMEKHGQRFFTMWYGVYDRENGSLSYACGGHPAAVLFQGGETEPHLLEAKGAALGIFEESIYEAKSVNVPPGSVLYLFSDGVFEVADTTGLDWPMDAFYETLRPESHDVDLEFSRIMQAALDYCGMDRFEDDYSILRIRFPGQ